MTSRGGGEPPRRRVVPLPKLGRDADGGSDEAMHELTDRAEKQGLDPDDYATWADLASALRTAPRAQDASDVEVVEPTARTPRPRMQRMEQPSAPTAFCRNCGAALPAGVDFCGQCGTRRGQQTPVSAEAAKTNGLAIAAFVLGLLPICGVTSILAIIFGIRASGQIRDSNGAQSGNGLAIAGIVLGIVMLLASVFIAIPTFLGARKRAEFREFVEGRGTGVSFAAPDGSFHATFPDAPKQETQTINAPTGAIPVTNFMSETFEQSFEVDEIPLTRGAPFNMQFAAAGVANAAGGTLQSSHAITVQGFPAMEFNVVTQKGVSYEGVVIKSPSHAFVIVVGGHEDPPSGFDRFKSSFQIATTG